MAVLENLDEIIHQVEMILAAEQHQDGTTALRPVTRARLDMIENHAREARRAIG